MPARSLATVLGLIFFSLALLVYFFSYDRAGLWTLRTVDYRLLFFLGWIQVASIFFHTLAVQLLLGRVGPRPRFSRVYLALTASLAVSYLLPGRLGLPARVYLYHRLFRLNLGIASGLVGWEIVVTTLIPLLFSLPALWIFYGDPWLFLSLLLLIGLIPALVSLAYFLRHQKNKRWLAKLHPLYAPFSTFFRGLGEALASLDLRALALFSFYCFLVLLCSVGFSRLLLSYMGSPLSLLTLFSVQSLSYIAGLVSLMPMGLGARELTLAFLLGQAGVPADVATYAALIQRVVATGLTFLLGLISVQMLGLRREIWPRAETEKVQDIRAE